MSNEEKCGMRITCLDGAAWRMQHTALGSKGDFGISCIISEGTNLGEEIYIESNQPLIHARVESLVDLEGAEIFTPAFSNESFSEFEDKEKGYRYVLRFIVNQAPSEKNWYHFTEAKITAESEKEKKTITVSLDHSYEVKESDAFTDWMHERSVFYGWNHLDFSDVLPQGAAGSGYQHIGCQGAAGAGYCSAADDR